MNDLTRETTVLGGEPTERIFVPPVMLILPLSLCKKVATAYLTRGRNHASHILKYQGFTGPAKLDTETCKRIARVISEREWPVGNGKIFLEFGDG